MPFSGWMSREIAPKGIGIDLVCISELRALDMRLKGGLVRRALTPAEQAECGKAPDQWTYAAGRYAVKEAVFKALAHLTEQKAFDYRLVETLSRPDGNPAITENAFLKQILASAGADTLLVSITHEGDYAMALVQAAGRMDEKDKK